MAMVTFEETVTLVVRLRLSLSLIGSSFVVPRMNQA